MSLLTSPSTRLCQKKIQIHLSSSWKYFATTSSNVTSKGESSKLSTSLNDKEISSTSPPSSDFMKETLLYRSSSSSYRYPRILLFSTTAHTGFWSWYVMDFFPSLAQQAGVTTEIDPTPGYVGLGLAIFMSMGSIMYPLSLISEIVRKDTVQSSTLLIRTLSVPFVQPSSPKEYYIGDVIIDSSNDVSSILQDHDGNIGKFDGHMALHVEGSYTNLLLNIRESSEDHGIEEDGNSSSDGSNSSSRNATAKEVYDNDLLFHSLVSNQVPVAYQMPNKKKKQYSHPRTRNDKPKEIQTLKIERNRKKQKRKRIKRRS